jgi:hypothetical protein
VAKATMYLATAACLSSLPIKIDRQLQDTLYLWPLTTSLQGLSQIWLTNSPHKNRSSPSTSLIFLLPIVWNGCQLFLAPCLWLLVVAIFVVKQPSLSSNNNVAMDDLNFLNLMRKSETQQQGGQGGVTGENSTCCACCAGGCTLVIESTQLAELTITFDHSVRS